MSFCIVRCRWFMRLSQRRRATFEALFKRIRSDKWPVLYEDWYCGKYHCIIASLYRFRYPQNASYIRLSVACFRFIDYDIRAAIDLGIFFTNGLPLFNCIIFQRIAMTTLRIDRQSSFLLAVDTIGKAPELQMAIMYDIFLAIKPAIEYH